MGVPETAGGKVESRYRRGVVVGGKYTLRRCMAVGGMGEIWVAKNKMTQANVALKTLRPDVDAQLEAEPRFRQEARLGAMLSHRNIVKVFDLIEEPDGSLVLVMELLHGETLADHLAEKGPLETAEAIALALPVLSALDHAHENGVVHRDLKPENVFLAVDPDGHVVPKLLDFGIAKIPEQGTKTLEGRVLGTPQYMSPEQIRADPKIDGRSDVFSVAVLVIKMLTGASPFAAAAPSAALAAVLESDVDPDPRIDPRVWFALKRALAKRPYERYARASELADALRQAAGLTEADLAGALRREKPPTSRRQTITARPSEGPVPLAAESSDPLLPDEPAVEMRSGARSTTDSAPDGLPRGRRGIFYAAVVAATVVVLGAVALWSGRSSKTPDTATSATSATVAAASAPTAPSTIPPPPPADPTLELGATPQPSATTPATSHPKTNTTHHGSHTTGHSRGGKQGGSVATTPGF